MQNMGAQSWPDLGNLAVGPGRDDEDAAVFFGERFFDEKLSAMNIPDRAGTEQRVALAARPYLDKAILRDAALDKVWANRLRRDMIDRVRRNAAIPARFDIATIANAISPIGIAAAIGAVNLISAAPHRGAAPLAWASKCHRSTPEPLPTALGIAPFSAVGQRLYGDPEAWRHDRR